MHTASLHNLVDVEGPFVSVFLDVGDHVDLRWRAMRDQLQAMAADPYLVALTHNAITSGVTPRGLAGRALVVGGGRVLIDQYVPVPPSGYTARYGPLPYFLPLIDLSEPLLPHVVVQVGEHGAQPAHQRGERRLVVRAFGQGVEHDRFRARQVNAAMGAAHHRLGRLAARLARGRLRRGSIALGGGPRRDDAQHQHGHQDDDDPDQQLAHFSSDEE